jgi:mercuric ion transport protein
MATLDAKTSLAAGVLAAVGASVCCVGPLVLLSLGVGGAWIGGLTAFEPYLAFAFHKLYLVPQVCEPGTTCADPRTRKRQRIIFWTASLLIVGLLAVPTVAPIFLL